MAGLRIISLLFLILAYACDPDAGGQAMRLGAQSRKPRKHFYSGFHKYILRIEMAAIEKTERLLLDFPELSGEHLQMLGMKLAERGAEVVESRPKRRKPSVRFSPGLDKRMLGAAGGFKVFLINGEHVRNCLETDFTMASHGYVSGFIPKDELWMDDRLSVNDLVAVLHHEIFEVRLMAKGMPYPDAHALATESEKKFRKLM